MDLRSGEGNGFAPLRGGEVGNVNGFVTLDYILCEIFVIGYMSQKMCHFSSLFYFCILPLE